MNLPLVSIMIPTFNQSDYLSKAIESSLAQDYSNLEIIISDDCSTDSTAAVINKYKQDKRIRYFRNERNIGRVRNYKKTLEEYASGEWAVNLDGDDYYTDSSFISSMINDIYSYRDNKIVFAQAGQCVKINLTDKESINIPQIPAEKYLLSGVDYFLHYQVIHHFSHLATLYNRKAAIDINFYNMNILSADIESFLRLALHGDVLLVKKSVGVWLQHGNNSSAFNVNTIKEYGGVALINSCYDYAFKSGVDIKKLDAWKRKQKTAHFISLCSLIMKVFHQNRLSVNHISCLLSVFWLNKGVILFDFAIYKKFISAIFHLSSKKKMQKL